MRLRLPDQLIDLMRLSLGTFVTLSTLFRRRNMRLTGYGRLLMPPLLGIILGLSPAAGVRFACADAPSSDSGAVTPAEISQALNLYFRDAAVAQVIRQKLVDRAAQQAGVSVSPQEVDAAMAQWNGGQADTNGGNLSQGFLTTALRREEMREEMLAIKIITKSTRLDNADFDRVEVQRIWCRTEKEANDAYQALINGRTLGTLIQGLAENPQLLGNIEILRYDQRLDPASERTLFTLKRGECLPPTVSVDPPGYEVLIVARQMPADSLTEADRQVFAKSLLQQKISRSLQDWWAAIEKQVESRKALFSGAAPPPAAPAPVKPDAIRPPAPKNVGGAGGSGGAIVLPPPGPTQ
ncbi:MAG TPA: hypothetical protein VFJ58_13915 [Armatimonadota bacterium]|nr:hypothetical protein [Armatimonadota bacterium]